MAKAQLLNTRTMPVVTNPLNMAVGSWKPFVGDFLPNQNGKFEGRGCFPSLLSSGLGSFEEHLNPDLETGSACIHYPTVLHYKVLPNRFSTVEGWFRQCLQRPS